MDRLIISSNRSGSGKTSITCAILKALVDRGLKVSTFKSGCDYIDGSYHSRITGGTSHNLDGCFCTDDMLKYILCENSHGTDISVIEGVMGYYDGIGLSTKSSTYELSKTLETPVVLILDCQGMGASLGATLKGFLEYRDDHKIEAVIFNRLSPHLYPEAESLAIKFGVTPLGYIPKLKDGLTLESRHLGLITAEEISNFDTKVSKLAEMVCQTVDIEKLLKVAKRGSLTYTPTSHMDGKRVRVAVSKDVAFSFLYGDNVDFLERSNCEVVYFSPLDDKELPKGVDGLILCGGYPELYAETLSKNVSMRESIERAIKGGIPYLAECGGFMYLQSNIVANGVKHPMVGIFHSDCYKTNKLVHFGYTKLVPESVDERMFNEPIITHEFHYSDTTANGSDYLALKLNGTQSWRCGYCGENFYAGYPHIYFYGNVQNINRFINAMVEYRG